MKNYVEIVNSLGYIEASPKPSSEELTNFYRDRYFQNSKGSYSPSYSSDELELFANNALVAIQYLKNFPIKKDLLDLGCGEGFFSAALYKLGWEVNCCDFSSFGIKKNNPQLLDFLIKGDIYKSIENLSSEKRKFGLLNLQNVLEHVLDPMGLLNSLKFLMDKDSILRIRVPNDYSSFQKLLLKRGLIENTWFTPPEHLSYFNITSLTSLVFSAGFQVHSVQADFPVEVFLAHDRLNYWKNPDLGKPAHMTRVICENYLIKKDIDKYIKYSTLAADLEFGRTLTIYLSLK